MLFLRAGGLEDLPRKRAGDRNVFNQEVQDMPGFDRTGPLGMGPMTGGRRGLCVGYQPPYAAYGYGYPGFFGRGRGWRHWYYATGLPRWARRAPGAWPVPGLAVPYGPELTKEQELEVLKNQAKYFEETLNNINRRLKDLEAA
jgi:hypothetical protein